MSQERILNVLEKQKEPLSRTEIAVLIKDDIFKTSKSIRKLLRHNEIKCIEINRVEAFKRFKCKRRMRLYYT